MIYVNLLSHRFLLLSYDSVKSCDFCHNCTYLNGHRLISLQQANFSMFT